MEKIEEYIRNNRDELEMRTPSPEVWKGIKKGMNHRGTIIIRWILAAAMITVIFTTGALFYIAENRKNSAFAVRETEALIMKINPQLKETEIYYNNLINNLYTEATPMLTGHPDIEKELVNDLCQVDSICADLKKDLRDNIANREVIEAMINNYRIKIRILEDMLEILKQNENATEKKDSHAL